MFRKKCVNEWIDDFGMHTVRFPSIFLQFHLSKKKLHDVILPSYLKVRAYFDF